MTLQKPIVDLFAGSGGLSTGLERLGFAPIFVSELHSDALSTYLRNRPAELLFDEKNVAQDILQLDQNSGVEDLGRRLNSDHGAVDLVVGGPPCQGYSGIGHRRSFEVDKVEIPSNHLYRNMANFVREIGPKAFIFENVRGLLNSRWTPSGRSGEIWEDVLNNFSSIQTRFGQRSYNLGWQLVHAKDFGVPQNRPRVILVGVRSDVNSFDSDLFGNALEKEKMEPPNLEDVFEDLVDVDWTPGGTTEFYPGDATSEFQQDMRSNRSGDSISKKGDPLREQTYSKHKPSVIKKFQSMIENEGAIPEEFRTKKFAQRLLRRRWDDSGPNITATSLADDYVHYSQPRTPTVREWARLQTFPDWYEFSGPRTTGGRRRAGDPSIGAWERDLPKYTQIGNAVPVRLAEAIGKTIQGFI